MVTLAFLRTLAASFPDVTEVPHFDKTSFRINKKIFATYDAKDNRACLKLSEADQYVFSTADKAAIHSVPNKWGQQGWTFVEMGKVKKSLFKDAVAAAYQQGATKKTAAKKAS